MSRENFWNSRILRWEEKNYLRPSRFKSWLTPQHVNNRLRFATQILTPHLLQKKMVDLGCGSGQLISRLQNSGATLLFGIDVSSEAIAQAQKQWAHSNSQFIAADAVNTDWPDADIFVGLGFLDWLTDQEMTRVFEKVKNKNFLFTYSEKRFSLQRRLHQIYVFLSYGWKSNGYVPRYYSEDHIKKLAAPFGHKNLFFLRSKDLAFGTFVANFEIALDTSLGAND